MQEVVIRSARADELARVQEIEKAAAALFAPWALDALFASTSTPREVLAAAQAEDRLIVAALDGHPIGFAMTSRIDGHAHLDEIDVDPAYGRSGIGTALLGEVIRRARVSGLTRMTLGTMREVPFNGPWYRRVGFRELEEHELGPGLRALLHLELAGGYPIDRRVIMALDL